MSERPKVQISKVCVVHSHPGFESQRYRHHGEGPTSSQELRGGPFAFPVSVPRFEAARVDGRRLLDVVRRPYCTRVGGHWGRGGCTPRGSGVRPVRTTPGQWIPTLVKLGAVSSG